MLQAALQAFQKDVKTGGSNIDALRYAAEEAKLKEKAEEKEQANLLAPAAPIVPWFEGVTEGGETYYWNMETGGLCLSHFVFLLEKMCRT